MLNADLEVVGSLAEKSVLAKKKFYLEKTIPVEIEDDDMGPPTPSGNSFHEPNEEYKTPQIVKEKKDDNVDQDDSFDDEDRTKEELQ
jgi:hypothetical protein